MNKLSVRFSVKLAIVICIFCSPVQAQFLLLSGETARSGLTVSIYATPGGEIISSRDLVAGLNGLAYADDDLLVVNLESMRFSLSRSITPYQYLITTPELEPFRLDQQLAIQLIDSTSFLAEQNITTVNTVGAIIYVGQFNPIEFKPLSFTPTPPPDFDEDGLSNVLEYQLGLSAEVVDSDGDGVSDQNEDSDGDGASNIDELTANTDPANPLDKPPVDECAINIDNCHANAFCSDTPESFICDCNAGFLGDGTSCVVDDGTDVIYRVSFDPNGGELLTDSHSASISVDGEFVAYVAQDSKGVSNCMVHTPEGIQKKANESDPSLNGSGVQEGDCANPAISRYGQLVAFSSNATNLTPQDASTTDTNRVFIKEMGSVIGDFVSLSSETILVSQNGNTTENASSLNPAISDNGRFVIYDSNGSKLASKEDTNSIRDVFIYDRFSATTELVSVPSNYYSTGEQAIGQLNQTSDASGASITDDGAFIAFTSNVDNLTGGDGRYHIIVRNRLSDSTMSITAGANADSTQPSISADGRWVAFESAASNLVANDNNNGADIFLHDMQTSTTTLLSSSSANTPLSGSSHSPDINADGRFVSFHHVSSSSNDIAVWLKDTNTAKLKLVSHAATDHDEVSTDNGSSTKSHFSSLSGSGNFVAFSSFADNMLSGFQLDQNQAKDVFVHKSQNLDSLTVQPLSWYLITLPIANVGITATPTTLFADDLGPYGQTWILWDYDVSLPTPDYVAVDSNTPLSAEGKGYWLIHLNDSERTLTIDKTQVATGNIPGSQPVGCSSPNTYGFSYSPNCTELPMSDNWTEDFGSTAFVAWNILGPNSTYYNTKEDMLFTTTGNNGTLCDNGCDIDEAVAKKIVYDVFWKWSPIDAEFKRINKNDYLSPWQGFWVALNTEGGRKKQRSLILPLAPLLGVDF